MFVITIFDEEFAPVTSRAGFIAAPLNEAVEAMASWHERLYGVAQFERLRGGVRVALPRLERLKLGSPTRWLLVDMGGWTAYFDNWLRGTDPIPPMSYLADKIGCLTVAIASIPHTIGLPGIREGRSGSVRFNMFGPLKTDYINYVRTVSNIYDGNRWVFFAQGTEQSFEEVDRYSAKRVRDRFTSDMLERYCAALDLFPFNFDAYGDAAVVFERDLPSTGAALIQSSIAQAQDWLEITPGMARGLPG